MDLISAMKLIADHGFTIYDSPIIISLEDHLFTVD